MRNDTKIKRGAILSALAMILLLGSYLAILLVAVLSEEEVVGITVLVIYGAVVLAVIIGILAALRQRIRELRSGEEEDAKKY